MNDHSNSGLQFFYLRKFQFQFSTQNFVRFTILLISAFTLRMLSSDITLGIHYYLANLVIFPGALSAFISGSLFSWSSPAIPQLILEGGHYNFTKEQCSYLTVLPSVTTIIAAFIYPTISDKIGRKYTLLTVSIPYTLSWILIALSENIYLFYLARLVSGFGEACIFSTLPSYIGEISSPKVRGFWGNALICYVFGGQLYINAVGGYLDIKTTAWISLAWPVIFIATFSFAPESPYYFMMKGRRDQARTALQKLRALDDVENELNEIEAAVRRQMSESCHWKELWTIKSNRKALIAGLFLRTSQQLSGMACMTTYTQYIFAQSGTNIAAADSTLIFVFLMLVGTVSLSTLLNRIGRRLPFIISLVGCFLTLAGLSAYFYLDAKVSSVDMTNLKWIPLAGMLSYLVWFSLGIATIPTLMLSELFSASAKPKALTVLIIVFGVCVSLTTKVFNLLETAFGLFAPFAFFSICCFCNFFIALKLVPETKGKTLEEIQQMLKK